jgi:hypothetical protein
MAEGGSITLDQKTIESALATHLFGETLADPEMRDQMLKDLTLRILREPNAAYDKESLLVSMVKKSVAIRVQEITNEWMAKPEVQEMIRKQVKKALEDGIVGGIVKSTAEALAIRIGKGW